MTETKSDSNSVPTATGNDLDGGALIGTSSCPLIGCNLNNDITVWNDASKRMCGYDAGEIVGRNLSVLSISDEGLVSQSRHMMEQALRDGFCEGTAAFRHKGGEAVVRPVLIVPQRLETGRLSGFLIVVAASAPPADVETVRTLRARIEAFDAANRAKDRFLSRMLHDFRTPLGGVIGFAATLLMRLSGPLTADQERQLTIIETCAKGLLGQLDRLPDALRIETGTIDVQIGRTSCRAVVEEAVREWREPAAAKGLALDVVIPDGDVMLLTDPRILGQIVDRLVDNAVTCTERGIVAVACDRPVEMPDAVCIRVHDTGAGLSPEDQRKLFQPFTLLASSGQRHGLGLGLYQAQKLAGMIGGHVSCRSVPGQGSVFTLTLAGGGGNDAGSGN